MDAIKYLDADTILDYLDDKYRDANNNVAARHMFKITGVETKKYEPSARNISLNL